MSHLDEQLPEVSIAEVQWAQDGSSSHANVSAIKGYGVVILRHFQTNGSAVNATEFLWREMVLDGARLIPKHPKVPGNRRGFLFVFFTAFPSRRAQTRRHLKCRTR